MASSGLGVDWEIIGSRDGVRVKCWSKSNQLKMARAGRRIIRDVWKIVNSYGCDA